MNTDHKLTLISGTNRKGSNTRMVTEILYKLITKHTSAAPRLLDLCELDGVDIQNSMFDPSNQHPTVKRLQNEYIIPADKFIFVVPEYNGSYPGILKYFIDACSIREYSANFQNKQAFLIGVSTGRAGNLRGLDHLTAVLNYLHTHVHPLRIPVSKVTSIFDAEKMELTDTELAEIFQKHLFPFVNVPILQKKSELS